VSPHNSSARADCVRAVFARTIQCVPTNNECALAQRITFADWPRPHRVSFEPGTFTDSTTVSIEMAAHQDAFGADIGGDVLKLRPSAVLFRKPALLEFYHARSALNTVYVEKFDEPSRAWRVVEVRDNAPLSTSVALNVSSFSYWRLRLADAPLPPPPPSIVVTVPFAARPAEPSDGAPDWTRLALVLAGLGTLALCGFGAIVLVCIRTRQPPEPAFLAHTYALAPTPYAAGYPYATTPPPACPAYPLPAQAYPASYDACTPAPWCAGAGNAAHDRAAWPLHPTEPMCFSASAPHQRPATPAPRVFYYPGVGC